MAQPLSRKTKTELLADYKKLQEQLEQARRTAAQVHEPRSQDILAKTEKQTEDDIIEAIQRLRATFTSNLNQLAEASIAEINRLQELREAVSVWQKNLEHYQNVTVAAEAVDTLLAEYDMKKRQFEVEEKRRSFELETTLDDRERQWQQTQEEKEYDAVRKRKQIEEEFNEKMRKNEKALAARAADVAEKETELNKWQQQVKDFSTRLEEELTKRDQEVTSRLKSEYDATIRHRQQEASADQKVAELQINNLRELTNRQQDDIASLKQALEEAHKQAQALAARVIEGNRPIQIIKKEEPET